MLDFDIPLNQAKPATETVRQAAPEVTETIRVTPNRSREHLSGRPVAEWNWSDLRDFIIEGIEQRHGPQVRDAKKEAGIVKSFISRWGIERAHAIAQASFDVYDGMWRNAPISINRFSKNSDPYFASIIADRLNIA